MNNYTTTSQTILKKAGVYSGKIDGDFGPESQIAARKYYDFPSDWVGDRLAIGVVQVYATRNNIKVGIIDGFWGNNTDSGYKQILKLMDLGPPKVVEVNKDVVLKPTYNNWPKQDYNNMVKFYGKIGENQTELILPYEMKLAWDLDTTITKISCHEKVHGSLQKIFKQTLDHYGIDSIKELHLDLFGGCLNVRKKRGGSTWSIHSWGTAVDLDPDRNLLKWGRDKAYFARSEYEPFWKIVENEGWTSLGKSSNFDWMHLQAANL